MEEASNIDKYSTIDQDAIRTSTLQIDSRREEEEQNIFWNTLLRLNNTNTFSKIPRQIM